MLGRCLLLVTRGFIVAGVFTALVMLTLTLPATSRLAELREGLILFVRGQPGLYKVHNVELACLIGSTCSRVHARWHPSRFG